METVETSQDIAYLVNEPNLNNLTPISLAVSMNSLDFVEELINHDADLSIPNSEGDTPLHIAVKANNIECVRKLLKSRNATDVIDRFNYSSENWKLYLKQFKIHNSKMKIITTYSILPLGMTPLHLAAQNGHTEILDILCDLKINLNIQEGTYGRTPLHLVIDKEELSNIACTLSILNAVSRLR